MSEENKEVVSKLVKITALSLLFMAAEFIGGYLAHSIAIWSDAFHLLSDVLAYVISLIAVLLSERKSPPYLTFGWIRAQTLGALFNVAFIYIVTIELFIEATHRMIKKDKV
jgi:zinc transporter 2